MTPGSYRLVARAVAEPSTAAPAPGTLITPGPRGASIWAVRELTIVGADVDGVGLTLEAGISVSARSDSRVSRSSHRWISPVRVSLEDPALRLMRPGTPISAHHVHAAGVRPRRWIVHDRQPRARHLPVFIGGTGIDSASWWPRSAITGERDLLDGLIEIGRETSMAPVVVTFSDRRSELSGTLQAQTGTPASDVFVIAYAADRKFWGPHARRVQAVRPGVDGRFAIKDLPPGDYLLAALTDVDQDEWQDMAFLEGLVPASIKVTIAEGEKKVQDLRIAGG